MKYVIACVLFLSLILTGCAGSSPDSDLVAKAVRETLTASAPAVVQEAPSAEAEPASSEPTAIDAPTSAAEPTAEAQATDTPTSAPTAMPEPTATATATDTLLPTATPEPTNTPTTTAPYAVASKAVNLRAGPGVNYPVLGTAAIGRQYEITGQNADGDWLELCCVDSAGVWVAKSVVTTGGDTGSVQLAANIPAPPPTPTPAPTTPPAPTAPPVAAVQRPGMHSRVQIGSWEIQAERVQNEKAVYQYDRSKVAMGRYAIVFVLAKNLAPGTQSISATLAPALKDDKGRIYDYSDPLTTERSAMIYATWEFSVGKTVFNDINPGVETPLLMLWDVNEDVQSLVLILTDGRNRVEWDLGNFSNIPPYQP